MNPLHASLTRPVSGVPAVASCTGVFSRLSFASALPGCAAALAVLALALSATPAEAARAKYETSNVTVSLADKQLPEGVHLSGPISRMPAFSPSGESSRVTRHTYGDVLISGRLPVPEAVEAWFSTMESGRDAREKLRIELSNLSREIICSWDVLEATPYKLEVNLQDLEQVWTLHISTREIRYVGPGSAGKAPGGTNPSAAAAAASSPAASSSAPRTEQSRGSASSTGGTDAITGTPSSGRSGPASRAIGTGSIESRLPSTTPVIRPPSLPAQSGSAYVVTTADGKVHQVANIIPSDDRRQITLVMADQKRVTFDRTQIKKIDRLAER